MSENDSLIRDTRSREKIISDINKNIFVEAGAGSGKTTMLVNRMVAMVEEGVPIDRICAITFTKAAANEFYERFQKLLIKRSSPEYVWEDAGHAGQLPEPTEISICRCKEALQNIDLCFMGTIDAFCAMLLSEHPSEAGVPSDNILISDEEAKNFYRQQYVRICTGGYGEELKKMSRTFSGLYWNGEDVFAAAASVFMNNRNVHFIFNKPEITDVDEEFASYREKIINALKCMMDHPELKYIGNKKNDAAWEKIEDIYKNIRKKWSTDYSNVIYSLKKLVLDKDQGIRIIPEAMDHYGTVFSDLFEPGGKKGDWLECNIGKAGGILRKLQNFQYNMTMAFMEACVVHLEKAMRDKGYMTYFDYLFYLREMLKADADKNDGKLIKHIYSRHSYFLIDEFQDTNPLQAEIFFYLTAQDPVAKWTDCMPVPGSLFIVGDPKQSIYSFRSADVNSFLRVRALFENGVGEVLSLSRNFRSAKELCEHYNCVFTSLMPNDKPGQGVFEEIPLPKERKGEFCGVFKYTSYTGGKSAGEHPDETDPVRIADIIDRLVDNKEYLICTGNDKTPRRIRYSDIMVITRKKKDLKPIMDHLSAKEIPSRVEGNVSFGENEALREISRIFSSVADRGDHMALYGALTGKLTGLTKEELLIFRQNGGNVRYTFSFEENGCENETARRVAGKINELRLLSHEAGGLSPAALFSKIMDDHRVYEIVNARDLEVVYYTLELLRNAEQSGKIMSLKDGADYLRELLSGVSKEERCLSLTESRDAVHMANLHKVKGLEAPVVILAAAASFTKTNDKRIEHRDKGSEGYIFNLPKDSGSSNGSYFETKEFADKKNEENAAVEAENDRLLYVAATRARNALIIHENAKKNKDGTPAKGAWTPAMKDGVSDIFDSLVEAEGRAVSEKDVILSTGLYEEAKNTCVLNDRDAETGTYLTENPSRLPLVSKLSDKDEMVVEMQDSLSGTDDETGKKKDKKFPALLGTMIHKLMEILVSARNKDDSKSVVDEVIKEYSTPEIEMHLKDLRRALSDVEKQMKNGGYTQTNGVPQDILGTLLQAKEVYCEVPFTYMDKKADKPVLWNGVMDVVYLKDGKWHIVDYKTNADGSKLDAKYSEQLKAYVKAFKATTGEEADALTYHIDVM